MKDQNIPYISSNECLIIPCNSDPKYHYWNGGQSLAETLLELKVAESIWNKYILKPYPEKVM